MAAAFAELKADLREAWQTGDLTFREYQQELQQLKADTTIGKPVAAGRAQQLAAAAARHCQSLQFRPHVHANQRLGR